MNECVEESTEWNKKNKLHFIQMRREKNVVCIALSIKNGWVFYEDAMDEMYFE